MKVARREARPTWSEYFLEDNHIDSAPRMTLLESQLPPSGVLLPVLDKVEELGEAQRVKGRDAEEVSEEV